MAVTLVLVVPAEAGPAWPPFLPSPASLPSGVAVSIERLWSDPTFERTVKAATVGVPFQTYIAFVDMPDVTAAAARHLDVARYEVDMLGEDWYHADDHNGAQGVYRVLAREPRRRVILSWGSHTGAVLGTIRGRALSVLDFEERGGEIEPTLTAYVLIEDRVAAALARALVPLFGRLVDHKLTEGFRVTAKVAEWAVREPDQFCAWFASESFAPERRARLMEAVAPCQPTSVGVTRRP